MRLIEINHKWNGSLRSRNRTEVIIIHHADTPRDVGAAEIHQWHLGQGWLGIGYHYVVRMDGTVETGRPLWSIGSHAGPTINGASVGICLAGNFEQGKPTEAQYKALAELIKVVRGHYGNLPIKGHRDYMQTDCPGRNFDFGYLEKLLDGEVEEVPEIIKINVAGKEVDATIINGHTFVDFKQFIAATKPSIRWDAENQKPVIEIGKEG